MLRSDASSALCPIVDLYLDDLISTILTLLSPRTLKNSQLGEVLRGRKDGRHRAQFRCPNNVVRDSKDISDTIVYHTGTHNAHRTVSVLIWQPFRSLFPCCFADRLQDFLDFALVVSNKGTNVYAALYGSGGLANHPNRKAHCSVQTNPLRRTNVLLFYKYGA